jgi:pilus assembly protein Flp/PilA
MSCRLPSLLSPRQRPSGERKRAPLIDYLLDKITWREDGQGLAEYALILALIAIVAIVALLFLGGQVRTILSTIGKSI